MSVKATKFQELLGNPLNTFNFVVDIQAKGFSKVSLLVASTTFPSQTLQEFQLYFQGERVKFPSIPSNSGEWNCTMPEGELQKVMQAMKEYMDLVYDDKTGILTYWAVTDKFTIEIYPRQLRGDVNGSNKLYGVRLHGCYFKGRESVNLDNGNPTGNWVWNLNFSYDWMEDIKPASIDQSPAGVSEV